MKALKKTNEVIDFDARRGHNKGGEVDGGSVGSWLCRLRTLILLRLYCLIRLNLAVTALRSFLAWPIYIYILWHKSDSARLKPGWAHFGLRPSCTGRAGKW